MTHLISSAWELTEKSDLHGFAGDLASFALRERVDRVVIGNVLAPAAAPAAFFSSQCFREELDEFSPLTRSAHHIGLTWVLGSGDRVLGHKHWLHIRTRLENRGIAFLDAPAPVLAHDGVGRPQLVWLAADRRRDVAVWGPGRAFSFGIGEIAFGGKQDTPATEAALRGMAVRMAADGNAKIVVHDLPALPSWQRIGPHAGAGVWFGCAGTLPHALLLDTDAPWTAKIIKL